VSLCDDSHANITNASPVLTYRARGNDSSVSGEKTTSKPLKPQWRALSKLWAIQAVADPKLVAKAVASDNY
jgi:hypothetical protein